MTDNEMKKYLAEFSKIHGYKNESIKRYVVISEDSFDRGYTEEEHNGGERKVEKGYSNPI